MKVYVCYESNTTLGGSLTDWWVRGHGGLVKAIVKDEQLAKWWVRAKTKRSRKRYKAKNGSYTYITMNVI